MVYAASPPKGAVVAYAFHDIETDTDVASLSPGYSMKPASALKIITAFAAVKLLPQNFKFITAIYTTGKVSNGELMGNIYIKCSGDPTLSREDIYELIGKLKSLGINRINGNVYLDKSIFDDELYGFGWDVSSIKFCYSAPVSAAMVDSYCSYYNKQKDVLNYQPAMNPAFISLDNNATSLKDAECDFELSHIKNNQYRLHGCTTADSAPENLKIAIMDPDHYTFSIIDHAFKQHKIIFNHLQFGKTASNADLKFYHESVPLDDLIIEMLKNSNNQIADSLFKTFSYLRYGQGSWKKSQKIVTNLLNEELELKEQEIKILDGSGLSYHNLISVNALQKLLLKIYQKPDTYASILKGLPTAPINGTLERRFLDTNTKYTIQAKTGTLADTSTLSGYITTDRGNFIFTIMTNNSIEETAKNREFEENLIREVMDSLPVKLSSSR